MSKGASTVPQADEANLNAIADLLEDLTLTDSAILGRDDWRERVGKSTRPFLDAVTKSLNIGKATPYNVGKPEEGRECLDNIHWAARQKLRLTVRLGPWFVSEEVTENLLVWGIFAWVTKNRERESFMYRLKEVDRKVTGFRLAEAPVRGLQSGYVGLIKSLEPEALRRREAADLIAEIKQDLEDLSLRF